MCYMVSVGLSKSAQQKWLPKLPPELRTLPACYEGLSEQMNLYSPFVIVKGWCSCSLFAGSSYKATLKKYKRKGWSQNRIERTIADIEKNLFGLNSELRNWLADAATDAGEAFLFIHWDSDALKFKHSLSLTPDEMRNPKVDVKAEQLIHIKA